MTNEMHEENTTNKLCVDCKSQIGICATKCKACGSYQGLRRYVVLGQNYLALLLSFVAIFTAILHATTESYHTISDRITSMNRPFEFTIVKVDLKEGSFLVVNRTPHVIVVDSIQCGIHLFLDSPSQRLKTQQSQLVHSSKARDSQSWAMDTEQVMGVFLVSFNLGRGVPITSNEREIVLGQVKHISPPLQTYTESEANERVANYCFASGVDEFGEAVSMMTLATRQQSIKVDLLSALEAADFHPEAERARKELISKVQKHRSSDVNDSELSIDAE